MRQGSSDPQWILGDHLGSTSVIANFNGSFYGSQGYKAWGETRFGSSPTRYQFTGQYNDSYIKLYWYGSRWFDPELGRWTQPDLIVPGLGEGGNPGSVGYCGISTYSSLTVSYHENQLLDQLIHDNRIKFQSHTSHIPFLPINSTAFDRYAYAFYNPIRYTDPSGHCPFCVALAFITPPGWAVIGVTTLAVGVYFAVPGVRTAVTNGIQQAGEAVSNEINVLQTKKDWIPPGMSKEERDLWGKAAELYKKGLELPPGFQLPKSLAEKLKELIKQGLSPEEAADALDELEDSED